MCPAYQKIPHPTFRKANIVHRGHYANTAVHPRIKRTSDGLSPISNLAATPPQRLHPRTLNPYRFHCGRWKHERVGARSQTLPPRGELETTFTSTYARWMEPFHLIAILSSNSTDLPKKTPRPIPARPTSRSALVRTQLCELCLHHCACPSPAPAPPLSVNGKDEARTADDNSM